MAREERKAGETVVAVDVGGTKVLGALIDAEGRILARQKQRTGGADGVQAVLDRIAESVEALVEQGKEQSTRVVAVGVGIPGPVEPATGRVSLAPNLGWKNVKVRERLEKRLAMPVAVENDVNVGTLGEHVRGAGRSVQDLVGIFVGTGIGGGVVLGGQLHRGFNGAAGEIGHLVLNAKGPRCGCGQRGCLEAYASRTAIGKYIMKWVARGEPTKIAEVDPRKMTSGVLRRAVEGGDPLVAKALRRAAKYLGLAVVSVIHLVNPEMVVLGGGVIEAMEDQFLDRVRKIVQARCIGHSARNVQIVPAELGDDAGVQGAAELAWRYVAQGAVPEPPGSD